MVAPLPHKVAFERPTLTETPTGTSRGWSLISEARVRIIYQSGSEAGEGAGAGAEQRFKLKLRSCFAARSIGTDCRMLNLRDGSRNEAGEWLGPVFNVIEVDAVTDPAWVWIVVAGGVAV